MPRGGSRPDSGRKKLYGEKTTAIRVPESVIPFVQQFLLSYKRDDIPLDSLKIIGSKMIPPLYTDSVSAGFPSPAADNIERNLDLNEHLIKHPAATFFVRASGNSMINAGIHSGDILIVDRSLSPKNNAIIIAILNNELTVKRLVYKKEGICLVAENPDYPSIDICDGMELSIWGIVTTVIHQV